MGGVQVGQVQDGEQLRSVLLRYIDFSHNSLAQLQKQVISLPNGSVRPLTFFATKSESARLAFSSNDLGTADEISFSSVSQ